MKKTFLTGALGYGLLEILWRGRTHPSMLLAGGICLCGIKKMCEKKKNALLLTIRAAAMITAVEFIFGLIFLKCRLKVIIKLIFKSSEG